MQISTIETQLRFSFVLPAPIEKVWEIIATPEGLKSFFCPDLKVEMKREGAFELYFDPEAPPGEQGSEGMKIRALEEGRSYSFSWNNPPSMPEIREEQTLCQFVLISSGEQRTGVNFIHFGFGTGENWQKSKAYFRRAWGDIVLPRLRYRVEKGPFSWENLPNFSPWSLNRHSIEDPRGRLKVRTAGEEDLDLLLEMLLGLRRDEQMDNDVSHEDLTESMRSRIQGDFKVLIFQDIKEQTVGYTLSDPREDPLYLKHLYVVPDHRKKGYGRDLMDLTLKYFDACELDLYVLSWNKAAQGFYRHLGLKEREIGMRYRSPSAGN